jgi:hypothetical protein
VRAGVVLALLAAALILAALSFPLWLKSVGEATRAI